MEADFLRIREQLKIPASFPSAVVGAAEHVAARDPGSAPDGTARTDCRELPFVTVDPEGSLDLDQAFYAERAGDGYHVSYAIADVAHFVDRGGDIEEEAWRRGETLYSPDLQTPLYPVALSQGAASLLRDVDRPCVLFALAVDAAGRERLLSVERARIRSRAELSYEHVSTHLSAERERPGSGPLAGHAWSESLSLLEEIGRKRQALEVERGGVSLPIAAQHVQRYDAALRGYRLAFRNPNDVEGWNAEISLMTGMAAATLMCRRGVGLLRALDPPRQDKVQALRLTADALGVAWPADADYATFIRSLDPTDPLHAAVIFHASGAMGAARYVAFEGEVPPHAWHAAIAAHYSHVTAPLRRLADRYVLDLLVELAARTPRW
jgi:exoribonuclease R